MTTLMLQAQSVSRFFGGLKAVEDVSVDLHRDELHAVIGMHTF